MLRPGMTILDVGAGTGFLTIEVAQRCGADSQVSFRERFVDGSSLLRHHFMRLGFVPAWKSIVPEGPWRRRSRRWSGV